MITKLDNDLYKFTMQNAVYQLYPDVEVEYKFQCRNKRISLAMYADKIKERIMDYCDNSLISERDLRYIEKTLPFLSKSYLLFLKQHKSSFNNIHISTKGKDLELRIKGKWLQTILDEVPILAIISEVFMVDQYSHINNLTSSALKVLKNKLSMIEGTDIKFADFGTRRRFSSNIHESLMFRLCESKNFVGTSNLKFAQQFDIKPIGTMAHEWLQAGQAFTHPFYGQRLMLDNWLKVYKGNLGIALTDVIGIDNFLKDFDLNLANAFSGVRHDSGCPSAFGNKMIGHYRKLGINPLTKTIVFSDGLDFETMAKLHDQFSRFINVSFGIGTNLTNHIPNTRPLQIVLKLVKVNGLPVAKLSDSEEKGMCEDEKYLEFLKTLK